MRSTTVRTLAAIGFPIVLATSSAPAFAGSVFMKNGYIIQGPIVDEDGESIVLGWQNGKVTIHHRFVDTISYDPGEKERMEILRRFRIQEEEEIQDVLEPTVVATDELDDLPADLDVFLERHGGVQVVTVPDATVVVDSPNAVDPEPVVTVEPPRERPVLGRLRVKSDNGVVSILPPREWRVERHEGAELHLTSGDAAINVIRLDVHDRTLEDCAQLVKAEQESALFDYEFLGEGETRLGEFAGREIVSRGTLQNTTRVCRQILVPHEGEIWLVSSFVPASDGEAADYAVVAESLATLEFTADTPAPAAE